MSTCSVLTSLAARTRTGLQAGAPAMLQEALSTGTARHSHTVIDASGPAPLSVCVMTLLPESTRHKHPALTRQSCT